MKKIWYILFITTISFWAIIFTACDTSSNIKTTSKPKKTTYVDESASKSNNEKHIVVDLKTTETYVYRDIRFGDETSAEISKSPYHYEISEFRSADTKYSRGKHYYYKPKIGFNGKDVVEITVSDWGVDPETMESVDYIREIITIEFNVFAEKTS